MPRRPRETPHEAEERRERELDAKQARVAPPAYRAGVATTAPNLPEGGDAEIALREAPNAPSRPRRPSGNARRESET